VKIIDFGLSKTTTDLDSSFTYTTAPTGLGGWFASEVMRRSGRKTSKVGTGCCLPLRTLLLPLRTTLAGTTSAGTALGGHLLA
jgi:hypothetical protein